jgi:hypothetical protein
LLVEMNCLMMIATTQTIISGESKIAARLR